MRLSGSQAMPRPAWTMVTSNFARCDVNAGFNCAWSGEVERTASRIFPIPDSERKLRNCTGAVSVPGSLKRGALPDFEAGTDAGIRQSLPTCTDRNWDVVSAVTTAG